MKKKYFIDKYRISPGKFRKAKISWKSLLKIYEEFRSKNDIYQQIAEFLSNTIAKVPNVHSTRFRVKDPEHLIEKIIRKNSEENRKINEDNFKNEITDLVGVRAMHLYKKDWREIDFFLRQNWEVLEPPKAYYREGDDKEIMRMYEENGCENHEHPYGYRSIHYLIKIEISKEINSICEIQVRTIFEEGWSEIDHKVRYPYMTEDKILAGYLGLLNKICGSADDMATFIDAFLHKYNYLRKENSDNLLKIEELESKINKLSIESKDKSQIISELKSLKNTKTEPYDYEQYLRTCRICGKVLTYFNSNLDDKDLCRNCSTVHSIQTSPLNYISDSFATCSLCGKKYFIGLGRKSNGICSDCKTGVVFKI